MNIDLTELEGVRGVEITRRGDTFEVTVGMDTLEFSPFEKVIQKELELFDEFPGLTFNFNITLADQAEAATSVLHAR